MDSWKNLKHQLLKKNFNRHFNIKRNQCNCWGSMCLHVMVIVLCIRVCACLIKMLVLLSTSIKSPVNNSQSSSLSLKQNQELEESTLNCSFHFPSIPNEMLIQMLFHQRNYNHYKLKMKSSINILACTYKHLPLIWIYWFKEKFFTGEKKTWD